MKYLKIISQARWVFLSLFILFILYSLDIYKDFSTFKSVTNFQLENEILEIERSCVKEDCLGHIDTKIGNSTGNIERQELLQNLRKTVLCYKYNIPVKLDTQQYKISNNLLNDNLRIKLGLCYARKGMLKEAEYIFNASTQRDSKVYLAQFYAINNQPDKAVKTYEDIIKRMPDDQKKALSGIYKKEINDIISGNLNYEKISVFRNQHKVNY